MIDVAIDLNLHDKGLLDGLLTRFYIYNLEIDPLAAGGTIIIANQTEKVPYTEDFFEQQHDNHNRCTSLWEVDSYNDHNTLYMNWGMGQKKKRD